MSRLSIDAFPFLHGGHYLSVSVHREFSCRRLTGLCHRTVSWGRLVRCWVMRSVTPTGVLGTLDVPLLTCDHYPQSQQNIAR
jgi:hypothetical protein